jgi:DNA (cytosine-5)-methyltransferase 1
MGLIIDSFAGGGGASTGIKMATGRDPDIAINHNAEAMAMHKANHPGTKHYIEDIWGVDPITVTGGQPVDLMWLSPDCTHFSKAKGSAPKSPRIRGLAWIAVKWAKAVRPKTIILENVEEFKTWGPLDVEGNPIKALAGQTFDVFIRQLRDLGYTVEHRELVACDYGAPTSRKRFFLIANFNYSPVYWPIPTHGPGRENPYRTAAECIDWSIPCPSIFGRNKPLADKTLKRIARGVVKFVLANSDPYISKIAYGKHHHEQNIAAFLAQYHSETTDSGVRGQSLNNPMLVIDSNPRYALAACSLTRQFGTSIGQDIDKPMLTVMPDGSGKTGLVSAFLTKYYGNEKDGCRITDPMDTITGKDRMGLVTVAIGGENYIITDIGLRMLQPRELFNAQGFPEDYIIDPVYNGRPMTKTAQVRMCGNSVCPPVAEALVRANYYEMQKKEAA